MAALATNPYTHIQQQKVANLMLTKQVINNLLYYIVAFFITAVVLWFLVYVPGIGYSIPLSYEGDGLVYSGIIKSIMDSKYYVASPFLAAPLGFSMAGFPIYTPLNYFLVWALSFFFQDYGSVINTYYYLTYFFATLISFPILRKFGLNKPFALSASILFTFIPYHYMRNIEHLFINVIFIPPIYIFLAWSIFNSIRDVNPRHLSIWHHLNSKNIGLVLLAILGGSSSSAGYFAFFGCFILLIAGITASINKGTWHNFFKASVLVFFSGITFLISMSPTIINNIQNGSKLNNASLSVRVPEDAERYSLKITQLLFPVDGHRIRFLRNFKQQYILRVPLENASRSATLGIISAIGFLILLSVLLIRKFQENNALQFLSIMNISCLLLGTTGGFGSIFSFVISPMLRGYERISVYISFISLLGFFVALQAIMKKLSWDTNKRLVYLMAVGILCIGLLDQISTSNNKSKLEHIQSSFISDAQFIKSIEKIMPVNSAILQLPFLSFPAPSITSIDPYEHFKAYLHSHTLRWSNGAAAESSLGDWQQHLATLPPTIMIQKVIAYGFTGIYISRNGYQDKGRNLENEIYSITKIKPFVNQEGTLAFYDLRTYINNLEKKNIFNKSEIRSNLKKLYINYDLSRGFSFLERSGDKIWHWSNKNSRIVVNNYSHEDIPVKINFKLQTAPAQKADIFITGDLIKAQLKVGEKEVLFSRSFVLKPGKHTIDLDANVYRALSKYEFSKYFRLNDFSLSADT